MRARTATAASILLLTALTACGNNGDSDTTNANPQASKSVDCTDQRLSQADWTKYCSEENDGATASEEETLTLGDPAETIGDDGTGVLEVTPDTIVFAKQASGEKAANGIFVVVTMRDRATKAVAADEPAPISGGGWAWIAPDGEQIAFDSGNSSNVTMDKYNNSDPVQPGTYQWRAQAFDVAEKQAQGGTLLYTDGEGTAYRWKMPSKDSGPHVAEVKAQLAG